MAATQKTLTPTNEVISIPAFADKPDYRLPIDSTGKLADAINALYSFFSTYEDVTSDIQLDTGGEAISNDQSCIIYGPIVVLNVNMSIKGSLSSGANLLKGLPRAGKRAFATAVDSNNERVRMFVNNYGILKTDDAVTTGGWINVSFVYPKT